MKSTTHKLLFILLICGFNFNSKALNIDGKTYESKQYGYSIFIPNGFYERATDNKNVDLKVSDNFGNSIVVIVKVFQYNITSNNLQDILKTDISKLSPFKVSNVEKGIIYLNAKQTVRFKWDTKDEEVNLTQFSYSIPNKNMLFTITITMKTNTLSANRHIVEEIEKSIKIK